MYTLQVLYTLGSLEEERAIEDEGMLEEGAGRDGLHKARAIFDEVLCGRLKVFGLDHLQTLTVKAKLAGTHLALGDVGTAEREVQQVFKAVNNKGYRRLGLASAAISWMCLSVLIGCASIRAQELEGLPGYEAELKELRRHAGSYAKQMAEGMGNTLGRQHSDTLAAARVWAEVLYAAGDVKAATKVAQRFGIAAAGTYDYTRVGYLGLCGP